MRTFIDQYNQVYRVKNIKELQSNLGERCTRMYQDSKDGTTYRIGYVEKWVKQ